MSAAVSTEKIKEKEREIFNAAQKDLWGHIVAAATGTNIGFWATVDTVLHPLDNMLYPISSFVHDGIIILSQHTQLPFAPGAFSNEAFSGQMRKNYDEAWDHMIERYQIVKSVGKKWDEATPHQRTEMLFAAATPFLLPGAVLKVFKTLRGSQQQSALVHHRLKNRELPAFTIRGSTTAEGHKKLSIKTSMSTDTMMFFPLSALSALSELETPAQINSSVLKTEGKHIITIEKHEKAPLSLYVGPSNWPLPEVRAAAVMNVMMVASNQHQDRNRQISQILLLANPNAQPTTRFAQVLSGTANPRK